MPKPMDEDRARRKQVLAQKRAARKQQQQVSAAAAAVHDEPTTTTSHARLETGGMTASATPPTATTARIHSTSSSSFSLADLPEDALHHLYGMLSAIDLGRLLLGTGNTALHRAWDTARVSYLLTRLNPHYHGERRPTTTTTLRRAIRQDEEEQQLQQQQQEEATATATATTTAHTDILCATEQEARQLWDEAQTAGRTTTTTTTPLLSNSFLAYALFLEQAVSQYATVCSNNHNNHHSKILLPPYCHGRFASASPEHSLVRVNLGSSNFSDSGSDCDGGADVASWGVGHRGQLGHGQRHDQAQPRRLRLPTIPSSPISSIRIVQVAAGGGLVRIAHSLLLTSHGRVLSFGTGQYGALGHGYSAAKQLPDYLQPAYIQALLPYTMVCVAAGELHSAAVTSDGDVYTWGDGFTGQLGHGNKRPQVLPQQVTTGGLDEECIAVIACGSRHTLAVTEDTGECYSWGLGHFGVLGRDYTPFEYDADAAVVPLPTTTTTVPDNHPHHHNNNNNNNKNNNNDDSPAAATTRTTTGAAATQPPRDDAAELAAHLDLIASLSLDDASDQCIPKKMESLDGIRIVSASAGHRHSLLLDADGALYSCGTGYHGCLGHGGGGDHDGTAAPLRCRYPTRIVALEGIPVRQFSAGVDLSLCVSRDGHVYAWGNTEGGRLGLGMPQGSVTLPRRVVLPGTTTKIVDVECGYVHSLLVGLDGTLHVCGGVGVDGADDGQQQQQQVDFDGDEETAATAAVTNREHQQAGLPRMIPDFNIWHRWSDSPVVPKKERWKKYGKYEVKGRTRNGQSNGIF